MLVGLSIFGARAPCLQFRVEASLLDYAFALYTWRTAAFYILTFNKRDMPPPEETKTFVVRGDATVLHGSRRRGGRTRKTARLSQHGGDAPPPPATPANASNVAAARAAVSTPAVPLTPGPSPAAPPTTQEGGAGQAKKVILAPPKKKQTGKVILAPPKRGLHSSTSSAAKTRKIRVGLNGMRKRMTRAKKIHSDSQEKSASEIRKLLVESKLIKADSKVPEPLMRSMYKDYLLLKDRAL
jgi:hypothetical protein